MVNGNNNNYNRPGRGSSGRGYCGSGRGNGRSNNRNNGRNNKPEYKFVPFQEGKPNNMTYDTVKEHIVSHMKEKYKYGHDMAKYLEAEEGNFSLGGIDLTDVEFAVGFRPRRITADLYEDKEQKTKSFLLLPYMLWLCIATSLNLFVLVNN